MDNLKGYLWGYLVSQAYSGGLSSGAHLRGGGAITDIYGKLVFANLILNSLLNKFSSLIETLSNNIDILVLEETKIDESFSDRQFFISSYKRPYRVDRNRRCGGIIVYVRENIPSRKLDTYEADCIEVISVKINLRKSKWLMIVNCTHPSSSKLQYFN